MISVQWHVATTWNVVYMSLNKYGYYMINMCHTSPSVWVCRYSCIYSHVIAINMHVWQAYMMDGWMYIYVLHIKPLASTFVTRSAVHIGWQWCNTDINNANLWFYVHKHVYSAAGYMVDASYFICGTYLYTHPPYIVEAVMGDHPFWARPSNQEWKGSHIREVAP